MLKGSYNFPHIFYTLLAPLFLIGVALIIRFLALDALSESIYYRFMLPDERYYHEWALTLLEGKAQTEYFLYAPLPAYLMALIYKLFSVDINHIRVANILFNTAGSLLVYCISLRLVSKKWALIALVAAISCRELVFYAVVPLKTSLVFFLFALLIYLGQSCLYRFSLTRLFFLGLVLGLCMEARPNVILLLPLLPVLILFLHTNRLKSAQKILTPLGILLGFILSTLPFSLHQQQKTDKFSLLPVQSGLLFYCTNTITNPTPFYRPVSFSSSLPEEQGIHFQIEANIRTGQRLDAKESSQYWRQQAILEFFNNPHRFLQKGLQKLSMLFSFSENGDHYHIGFISGIIAFFTFLPLQYHHILILGYTGIALGMRHSKQIQFLAAILGTYLLSLVLFSTGTRFSLPLVTILIPAGVWSLYHLVTLVQKKAIRDLITPSLLALSLLFLGTLPIKGAGDLSKHYNNLAFFYNQEKDTDSAVQMWQQSADLQQTYSDVALLFLTGFYYQKQGMMKAIATLESIADTSFMAAAKYATLGDIYQHHGQQDKALKAYRSSLQLNSGQRRVRHELVRLLQPVAPLEAAQERLQLEKIETFYR